MSKILFVGELNPYGADPAMALYPMPAHASGNRLKKILGLSTGAYLRDHDRVNLCTGKWSMREAVKKAQEIHDEREGCGIVLLGVKVAGAFRRAAAYTDSEFTPWSYLPDFDRHYLCLPHPSGLNRAWNEEGAVQRARTSYAHLRRLLYPEQEQS